MTTQEFSSSFDTLLNSYATSHGFGIENSPLELNEFEKSLLLTTAQEEIVRGLYDGSINGESFEQTEELRRSLDSLIKTDYPEEVEDKTGLDKNSKFFQLKDDVWFITYESVDLTKDAYCEGNKTIEVIPVRQDEWHRIKKNPFRRPNKRKAVRLDNGDNIAEIISEYPIENYLIRYLSKPKPIILASLDEESIDGLKETTECELNTAVHRLILDRAVQLAIKRIAQLK